MRLHQTGTFFHPPIFIQNSTLFTTSPISTIDAVGEGNQFIGNIVLDSFDPGPKTLSAAGGGKIIYRSGATTWSNAGSNLRIGIQNIDASGSLIIGDGTFQVYGDVAGGSGIIVSSGTSEVPMTSGSIDLYHSSLVSMCWQCTSRGGSDSTRVGYISADYAHTTARILPITYSNTGSGWTVATLNGVPSSYIQFDDGSLGWFLGQSPFTVAGNVTFNVNTGTADEYGNYVVLTQPMTVVGVLAFLTVTSGAAFNVCIYSDPLGSPSLVWAQNIADKYIRSGGANYAHIMFDDLIQLPAGAYGITIKPSLTPDVSVYYVTYRDTSLKKMLWLEETIAIRRLDNSGAFSLSPADSICMLHLIGANVGVPVGSASFNLGV